MKLGPQQVANRERTAPSKTISHPSAPMLIPKADLGRVLINRESERAGRSASPRRRARGRHPGRSEFCQNQK